MEARLTRMTNTRRIKANDYHAARQSRYPNGSASISVSSTMKVAADAEKLCAAKASTSSISAPASRTSPRRTTSSRRPSARSTQNFTKYTPAGGTAELKKASASGTRADFGTDYTPAECVVTVGGKHVIFNLMQALINPGDEVVIPVPYWVTYKDVVNYAGGKCVFRRYR